MNISMAFQGGGAKLFDLLAAVSASRALERDNAAYDVTRVSGSSAGAVASAMYALDADIEQVLSQASYFDKLIERKFPKSRLKMSRIAWRIGWNKPIFDETAVHEVLIELFAKAGINASHTIANLMKDRDKQLRIVCSDILGLNNAVYDEKSPTPLIEALVDSCAIPFAFRMAMKGSAKGNILDGGLFQNLPAREALRDLKQGTRVLGISFRSPPRKSVEGFGPLKYAEALIDSMISERVEDSAGQMGPANVIRLKTDTETFGFHTLFKGDVRKTFKDKERDASGNLLAWMEAGTNRDSPDWFSLEKHDLLELEHLTSERVRKFYDSVAVRTFHAEEARHEVFAASLMGEEHADIYTTTLKLSGTRNLGLQFFRFLFYAPDGQQLLQPEVRVEDAYGKTQEALILPMREAGGIRARSVLICLSEPLGEQDSVTLVKVEKACGAMRRYLEQGWTEETLGINAGNSTQLLVVSAHFPNAKSPKFCRDASRDDETEASNLEGETGIQLASEGSQQVDISRGIVTYTNVSRGAAEPSDQRRFIKVFYYRALR